MTDERSVDSTAAARQALSAIAAEGSPLGVYLRWTANRFGDPLFHLCAAMSLAVHELSRKGFHLRRRQYPMNVWFALIGDSASGKGVAFDTVQRFSRVLWESAAVVGVDPWVEIEGTIAGVIGTLHEHYNARRGTTTGILCHEEFSAVLQTREPVPEMLCRIADGRTYVRHLKGAQDRRRAGHDEPDRVVEPAVSGLFTSTEEGLAAHFKPTHRQGGLFSRIWWVRPGFSKGDLRMDEDHDESPDDDELGEECIDAWIRWLVGLDLIGGESQEIRLSRAAHTLLKSELFDSALSKHQDSDDVNAVRLRVIDKARVFAAVFATMAGRLMIQEDDMRRAVAFSKLLLEHTSRVSLLGSSEHLRLVMRIERALSKGGTMMRRDMYRMLRVDKVTLDAVIETLIDRGEVKHASHDRGGVFVHQKFADQIEEEQDEATRAPRAVIIDITPGKKARPRGR